MPSDPTPLPKSVPKAVGALGAFVIAILCLLTYFLDFGLLDILGPIAAGVGSFAVLFLVATRLLARAGALASFLVLLLSGALGGAVAALVSGTGALLGSGLGVLAALVLWLSPRGLRVKGDDLPGSRGCNSE